jgi:hypothetical protein
VDELTVNTRIISWLYASDCNREDILLNLKGGDDDDDDDDDDSSRLVPE